MKEQQQENFGLFLTFWKIDSRKNQNLKTIARINSIALQALIKLRSKNSPVDPPRFETRVDKVVFGVWLILVYFKLSKLSCSSKFFLLNSSVEFTVIFSLFWMKGIFCKLYSSIVLKSPKVNIDSDILYWVLSHSSGHKWLQFLILSYFFTSSFNIALSSPISFSKAYFMSFSVYLSLAFWVDNGYILFLDHGQSIAYLKNKFNFQTIVKFSERCC